LLRPDFFTILEALIAAGIKVAIETNGLLVDKRLVDAIHDGQRRGVPTTISVSLDGGTPETHDWMRGEGTFGRTLEALRLLKSENISFRMQCVLHQGNIDSIPGLFETAGEFPPQLDYLIFAFLHPVGRGVQLWNGTGLGQEHLEKAYDLISRGMKSF